MSDDPTTKEAYEFIDGYGKFITDFWGPRCPDYEPECWCCKAWKRYDEELAAIDDVALK